ncbi:MAG TPA: flagellar hook-associated protein FlgL [Polyangia bacterium]|jgi:flagellar hook-associated protein 3 FlgL|nr:flagellar hook-associated protein FlgL [Polyangia bacterium]
MRVTDRMMFDTATLNAAKSRDRAQAAMEEVTTGMRVQHPGDDPAVAAAMVRGRQVVDRMDAINQNAGRAGDEVDAADQALQSLATVLSRARELAVQLGNDTYSASDRAGGAAEIDALVRQSVTLMNREVNGRFIFGGDQDRTPPFDIAGNYTGDTAVRQVEVAPGVLEDASVRADIAIKGVGGGVDLFATLQALSTALTTNNGNGIRGALTDIDSATTQVTSTLAKVGSMGDAFATAQTLATTTRDATVKTVATQAEADIFAASSKLALANHALDATLTAAAQSFRFSLMDKL